MRYGWDETKRRANLKEHGLDFTAAYGFEWETATPAIDDREDYGELREVATGFIGVRLHVLVFTERRDEDGSLIWIISLRRATNKEKDRYERQRR
jgi:uncharacterized DUF497 family protein